MNGRSEVGIGVLWLCPLQEFETQKMRVLEVAGVASLRRQMLPNNTIPHRVAKLQWVFAERKDRLDAIVKILLDETQLKSGVEKLAQQINDTYRGHPLTIIGVLTGSIVLLADVIRKLEMPLRVGVVQTSSYDGTQRGALTINSEMMLDITGRDVLLIDDIFDTGNTLNEVCELMNGLGPTSLRSAVLLCKTGKQQVDWLPEFVAFDIPDEFVVGYGLDYNDEYRNLPFLACLEPADLNRSTNETPSESAK